jgi:predicted ArsR family transcriptional regulator
MAEPCLNMRKQETVWRLTGQDIQKLMENFRAIRATADLLCAAADSLRQERADLLDTTLEEIGEHLEDLATEGLVILRYEEPRHQAQGGEA